jgi:DNA-binding MarR family transcriptional regulator
MLAPMGREMAWVAGSSEAEMGNAEAGLAVLLEACDRAIEDIGPAVPPAQLRALLIVGRAGGLNLNRLARALDSSASATSRLIDRMQAAGLLTRGRAAASRREIVLLPTESGRRLTDWVRNQHLTALARLLDSMSSEGRQALANGLGELATMVGKQRAAGRRQLAAGPRHRAEGRYQAG